MTLLDQPISYTFGTLPATPEQNAIVELGLTSSRNLIINALAGAAKTSTLELLCKYLPAAPILCLAFNKRIAVEMEKRLPSHVTCKTMNALGHRVWGTATGKRLNLAKDKSYDILTNLMKELCVSDKREVYEFGVGDTLKAIALAKRTGYIPDGVCPHVKRITTREDFFSAVEDQAEDNPSGLIATLIDAAVVESIKQSYAGTIDFDDQIYMPVLFGGTFPKFPLVMVDEAQDLSNLNHAMLRKLSRQSRLIAVGDPWQSIYAFRGAKLSGMQSLADEYDAIQLPLSVSFRCPERIVEYVKWRVPHMQWRKGGGHVEKLSVLNGASIPDGAAILCRNNAPLFRLALLLLRSGRGVHLVGTDLGPSLVKTLKKLGLETLTQTEVLDAIDAWEEDKKAKSKAKAAIADKADCLRVFARFGATLGEAIVYCDHLFKQKGEIQLLSVHKSKGLEWDTVFLLDPWRIPSPFAESPEALEQEKNLKYVACTRAKQTLFEIDLERIVVE